MPQMMLMRVVLPAPLGPSSAKISPRRMVRSTRLRAAKPLAYVLLRPEIDTIGDAGTGLAASCMRPNLGRIVRDGNDGRSWKIGWDRGVVGGAQTARGGAEE